MRLFLKLASGDKLYLSFSLSFCRLFWMDLYLLALDVLLDEMYLLRSDMTFSMLFLEWTDEKILALLVLDLWILGVDLNYCNYCIL